MNETNGFSPEFVLPDDYAPADLLDGALHTTRTVENPVERAILLAEIAVVTQDAADRQSLFEEALDVQAAAVGTKYDGGEYEFGAYTALRKIAEGTEDVAIIRRLEPHNRDRLLAHLAVKSGDTSLLDHDDPDMMDDYYTALAKTHLDETAASKIADPLSRMEAYAGLANDKRTTDPDEQTRLREKAWATVAEIEEVRYQKPRYGELACAWGADYAARLTDLKHRGETYVSLLWDAKYHKAAPEIIADLKQKALDATKKLRPEEAAPILYDVARYTGDMEVVRSIKEPRYRTGAAVELFVAQAIETQDATLIREMPNPARQGYALVEIVKQTGNEALARQIKDPNWRARALMVVSNKTEDAEQRRALQNEALDLAAALPVDYYGWPDQTLNEGQVSYIIGLSEDMTFVRRLLFDARLNTRILSDVARTVQDEDFARQLPVSNADDAWSRDQALQSVCYANKNASLAAEIDNAIVRARLYLSLYKVAAGRTESQEK
jgi:hypothetical protein